MYGWLLNPIRRAPNPAIIDPRRVGPGPSRTSFAGFGLRRIPSLLRRIWAGFWFSSSQFGGSFALVLARRLEGMEPRRWLAAAVLMCVLVLCGGRGRLLALLCSLFVSPPESKDSVFGLVSA